MFAPHHQLDLLAHEYQVSDDHPIPEIVGALGCEITINTRSRSPSASKVAPIAGCNVPMGTEARLQTAVPDPCGLLRSLQVEPRIQRVNAGGRLERSVDLIQRTTQVTSRSIRHDVDSVTTFVADPQHAVYSLAVKDRFADYGLVGMLIYAGNCVATFALSCRVIGLSPAMPLLVEIIRRESQRFPLSSEIVRTTRNERCRTVFRDAGFTECEGAYKPHGMHHLAEPPPEIFRIME
jgi:hypothetical protein